MAKPALLARQQLTGGLRSGVDQAVAAFRDVARHRPGALPIGDYSPFVEVLRQVLRIEPRNVTARYALAECSARQGEPANAEFISIIRDVRPVDHFASRPVDLSMFDTPVLRELTWHSIDSGTSFVEGLRKTSRVLAGEMLKAHLPDLAGKSVLDIGAFGGWFSFEAERRGARSVTALDYYSWVTDMTRLRRWIAQQREEGAVANAYAAPDEYFDVDGMPGRIVFDLTRRLLQSKVKPRLARFEDAELEPHDVVFLLGVLYHQENPYWMLKRVAELTKETLVLETLGVSIPSLEGKALWEFYGGGETRGDGSTFWAPTEQGLVDMLMRVGFREAEVLYGADTVAEHDAKPMCQCRMWVHARK